MDNQGNNFLSTANSFGVQQASVISDETADLIFGGGSTAATPAGIAPLRKKKVNAPLPIQKEEDEDEDDTQKNRDPFPIDEKMSADELLDSLGKPAEDDDDTEPTPAPKPKQELIKEPVEDIEAAEDADDTFSNLTKELIKAGVFRERDEDSTAPVATPEAFKERWVREKQEQSNQEIYNFIMSKHGQEGLDMFDSIFVKGVPPKDYLSKFSEIQKFETMDMASEDNQKTVFREAMRRQGLPEDKIERKLQRTIDYGDLEEETRDLHEILVKQEKEDMNFQLEEAEEAAEAKRQEKAQYANNLNVIFGQKLKDREFDGIPVTEKVARDTYDYLTSERWVLPSGEKLTDFDKDLLELRYPKNHELKVKLALLLKNKLDLTKIKNKAVSAESNRVFDTLVKRDTQARRAGKTAPVAGKSFLDGLQ